MLETLFSRLTPPPAGRVHDHLFSPFAPNGASAHVLSALFHRYAGAPPDEPPPPQHKHYRALVLEMIHAHGGHSPPNERLSAAYVACFERDDAFQVQLKAWRTDRAFCHRLAAVRLDVIADLLANERLEAARRAHFNRWAECHATPIDLEGETLIELIAQMAPDDWHEIALAWDWNAGIAPLEWMTAQRECDRATAVYILCAGWPGDVAVGKARPHAAFIRDLAARIEGGFYVSAEFGLLLSFRKALAFQNQLDAARATGVTPWRIPKDILAYAGVRPHAPVYAITNGHAHYQYDHWLETRAPPLR
jgi:hypothetical protein